jgi:hypothetical protein
MTEAVCPILRNFVSQFIDCCFLPSILKSHWSQPIQPKKEVFEAVEPALLFRTEE